MSNELGKANFMWETNSWAFSNSDNSCGSDDKKGKITLSSSPTPTTTPTPTLTPTTTLSTPEGGPKRSRNGVSKNGKGGGSGVGSGGGGGGESDHEIHILTERERRKKMRNMFSNLHALLPQLAPKADKSTIVDEAVSYIKTLENTLQKLEKQKLERLGGAMKTIDYESSLLKPNISTYSSTREAYLAEQVSSMNLGMTTNSSNALTIMPTFFNSFQTWSSPNVVLNVCGQDAQISVCAPKKPTLFTTIACVLEKHKIDVITAQIYSDMYREMYMIHAHVNGVSDHIQQMLSLEEVFKLAVGEIIFWMST